MLDLFQSQHLTQFSILTLDPQQGFWGNKCTSQRKNNLNPQEKLTHNNYYRISTQGSICLYFQFAISEFECNDEEKVKYVLLLWAPRIKVLERK